MPGGGGICVRNRQIFWDFEWHGLTVLRPQWLAGAAVALALFWLCRRRQTQASAWARAADSHLLAAMAARGGVLPGAMRQRWAPLAVAALAALALAGPALERSGASELRNLDAVLIVADLSDREASDADMTRLRFVLRRLAESAGTRQTGLIVYAGDAYLASALSGDPEIAGAVVAALSADTVPDPGAAPARALTLALKTLQGGSPDRAVVNADVVLVSGGAAAGEPEAALAASRLQTAGYRLSTVYAPSDAAKADAGQARAALAALADLGAGVAAEAANPEALLRDLELRPLLRWRAGPLTGLAFQDYGRWLLALAALASLALFRRSAA